MQTLLIYQRKQINKFLQNNMKKMIRMTFKSRKNCARIFLKEIIKLKLVKFQLSRLKSELMKMKVKKLL